MVVAALVAASLIGVVIAFQVALAAGAPWGAAAWGGRAAGRLPAGLRLASVAAAVPLAALGWVILAAAEVAPEPLPVSWLRPLTWGAAAYFALGMLLNAVSRSRPERIWAPISAVVAACCVVVALG